MFLSRCILLLTAFIWGSTFIAQRMIADSISPLGYNGIRFLLGAITILPLVYKFKSKPPQHRPSCSLLIAGSLCGLMLFAGATLQQYALAFTNAGKAAFLTSLYIVLVPIAGLLFGQRLKLTSLCGVMVALIGATLLTWQGDTYIAIGDIELLISTLFWVAHILLLNKFTQEFKPFPLAFVQFMSCGLFSLLLGELLTPLAYEQILNACIPILWGGILSVGIGFTGQLLGQQQVPPTEASLIMSGEMVFATILGYLYLHESLSMQELYGVILLSIGIILAQLPSPYSISPLVHKKLTHTVTNNQSEY